MLKRVLIYIVSAVMIVSLYSGALVSASKTDEITPKDTVVAETLSNNSIIKYSEYIENYSDSNESSSDLKVFAATEKYSSIFEKSQDRNAIKWEDDRQLTYNIDVPSDGIYQLTFDYKTIEGKDKAVDIALKIDGNYPYSEAMKILLPRTWVNSGENRIDEMGNETPPSQIEKYDWKQYTVMDSSGINTEPLQFALTAGKHSITLEKNNEEPVYIEKLTFSKPEKIKDYKDYISFYKSTYGLDNIEGYIVVEGESATEKSEKSFVGKADTASALPTPSSYAVDKINYIGSNNWSSPGNAITWEINVEKSGYYKLAFNYRQNYVLNGNSYRRLYIDGKVPFAEAKNIVFPYNTNWDIMEFNTEEDEPYLFYFDEGKHNITLEVTLGAMSPIYSKLSDLVEVIGASYRKIVMVMGTSPDANRDYDLFESVTGLQQTFEKTYDELIKTKDAICELTGKRSDSNTVVIANMADSIKKMLDNPYTTQLYKEDFYDNYCSIGAILSELTSMPLDIDLMVLAPHNKDNVIKSVGFFEKISFSIKRFFATFAKDYGSISGKAKEGAKKLSIWLYWGKDQVQVLNNLIKEDFIPNHNIYVDLKITNASVIQALLSQNTPDIYLRLEAEQVMNLAMRGALYDLKQFDDYESILSRFSDNASIPYKYLDGCYAIPDTENFNMLFYRTDIFEEYGLSLPTTWDEFLDISTFFFHNNLQVGMPNTFNTFATFLYQKNGEIYNKDLSRVIFTDNTFVDAFEYYTDFYTDYGFELTFDFYNRFRTGEMPMGIGEYILYNTLKVSAPEIDGKWAMVQVPGTKDENGINSTGVATGLGSVIVGKSKNYKEAWEFIKWWTDCDTQVRFCEDCESILGAAARQATANVKALSLISWESNDLNALLSQWSDTNTIPQTPGSYYTTRMYQQAFWSVVNNDSNVRNTLSKWGKLANQEIIRKRTEYNLE